MSSGVGTEAGRSRLEFGVAYTPDLAEVQKIAHASLAVIDRWIDLLPVGDALAVIEAVRGHADAREASLLAARLESGASARSIETLLQRNDKTSKRTAKKRARRAKAVRKNPTIATKMKSGELSPDQADVLASGAERTDGAAAADEDLIERVANTPPDQGRKIVDEWVREHTTNDDVQDRHDGQRRLRGVRRWTTDRDTDVLAIEGDTASIDRVELAIRNRSNDMYRADGGRDLPAGHHPRTRDQRNFDAAVELLTGSRSNSDGGKVPTDSKGGSPANPSPRSTIVVTMTVDQATGADSTPVQQVGGGLLAPTVLAEMFCGADIVGQVVDRSGQVLWQGHSKRYFTDAQVLALIARDQGCVWCQAHYSVCEAHHIVPWESPARGPTDIDNGALVCSDCHHWIHDHDQILIRDPENGTWTTRPARPHEIAPHRRDESGAGSDGTSATRAGDRRGRAAPETKRRRTEQRRPEQRRPRLDERQRSSALF